MRCCAHVKFFQVQALGQARCEHAAIASVRISRRISIGFSYIRRTLEDTRKHVRIFQLYMYHLILGTVGKISYNSKEVTNCETNSGNDTLESGVVQPFPMIRQRIEAPSIFTVDSGGFRGVAVAPLTAISGNIKE